MLVAAFPGEPAAAQSITTQPSKVVSAEPAEGPPGGPPATGDAVIEGTLSGSTCDDSHTTILNTSVALPTDQNLPPGGWRVPNPSYDNVAAKLHTSVLLPDLPMDYLQDHLVSMQIWLDDPDMDPSLRGNIVFANPVGTIYNVDEFVHIHTVPGYGEGFDDEPEGFALNPGMHTIYSAATYRYWRGDGYYEITCIGSKTFEAFPPLVEAKGLSTAVPEDVGTVSFTMHQMWKVDTDVTDYFWISAGPQWVVFDYGFMTSTANIGSTASAGSDFGGGIASSLGYPVSATNMPPLSELVFPAGEQDHTFTVTIIDDDCRERPEFIKISYVLFERDLPFFMVSPTYWIGWLDQARIDIIDDDPFICHEPDEPQEPDWPDDDGDDDRDPPVIGGPKSVSYGPQYKSAVGVR